MLKYRTPSHGFVRFPVSVLFNEPKLLKSKSNDARATGASVSVLFNEPKLLKSGRIRPRARRHPAVSVLFNEPKLLKCEHLPTVTSAGSRFSALQRAEIAEIPVPEHCGHPVGEVSVLFNEPKLLKFCSIIAVARTSKCFSALQRAEIAEMMTNR